MSRGSGNDWAQSDAAQGRPSGSILPISDKALEAASQIMEDMGHQPEHMQNRYYWSNKARAVIQAYLAAEGFWIEAGLIERNAKRLVGPWR